MDVTGLDPMSRAAARNYPDWTHAPVCRCGEPWPCQGFSREKYARQRALDRRDLLRTLTGLQAGECASCGQPVAGRQPAVLFDGPHVWRADLDGAVFHARKACRPVAIDYETDWLNAWHGRAPLLGCPGRVVEHIDGRRECDYPDCAGITGHVAHEPTWYRHACIAVWSQCPSCGDTAAQFRVRNGDGYSYDRIHGMPHRSWGDPDWHARWLDRRRGRV